MSDFKLGGKATSLINFKVLTRYQAMVMEIPVFGQKV
jgi:hypothetical protein